MYASFFKSKCPSSNLVAVLALPLLVGCGGSGGTTTGLPETDLGTGGGTAKGSNGGSNSNGGSGGTSANDGGKGSGGARTTGGASGAEFVHVNRKKGTFEYKGCEFRATGATIYPLFVASWSSLDEAKTNITNTLEMLSSNGVGLVRFTDIIWDFNLYEDVSGVAPRGLSDAIWSRVDFGLAEASRLEMKVILDLSFIPSSLNFAPHLCTATCKACCDFTDPVTYEKTNPIWSYVPQRRNLFTDVLYRDDPTIFSYAVTGEPMPYGRQYNEDGTVKVGSFASRDVVLLEQFSRNAATILRQNDPNHMVSTGGYNHLDGQLDQDGKTAWEALSSDDLFDYGAVHVYDNPGNGNYLQGYDWNEWTQYRDSMAALGKPFVIEETGVHYPFFANDDSAQDLTRAFFNNGFDWATSENVPVFVVWNWTTSTDAYDYSVNPNSVHPIVKDVAIVQKNAADAFSTSCAGP